jgi:hypothetical protein
MFSAFFELIANRPYQRGAIGAPQPEETRKSQRVQRT